MKKLVLDLDETLIFSSLSSFQCDELVFSVGDQTVYSLVRPGARQFLASVRDRFECYVWSTGVLPYIKAIMQELGFSEGFTLFGRDKCRKVEDAPEDSVECYEKQLTMITEDLTQIVIADNTKFCFQKYPMNGILIKTWRGDMEDSELFHLDHYLEWLRKQDNLQRNHSHWRLETLCMRAMRGSLYQNA